MVARGAHKGLIFGIFLAPFHAMNENPTQAMERDMQLLEHLDVLGYDEAWIGEHHSGGFEIIACPEIFIAGAAARTRSQMHQMPVGCESVRARILAHRRHDNAIRERQTSGRECVKQECHHLPFGRASMRLDSAEAAASNEPPTQRRAGSQDRP